MDSESKSGMKEAAEPEKGSFCITAILSILLSFTAFAGTFFDSKRIYWLAAFFSILFGISSLYIMAGEQRKYRGRGIVLIAMCLIFLAMVLNPQLEMPREQAQNMQCESNLKQIYKSLQRYAEANDGLLPIATKWNDLLLKNNSMLNWKIFNCPLEKKMKQTLCVPVMLSIRMLMGFA